MKFRINYNKRFNDVSCRLSGVSKSDAGKPVEVFGDLRPEGVPQDIFDDFVAACGEGRKVKDTLLWKAIRPDIQVPFARKQGFFLIIHGHGVAPNYLAEVQAGPYKDRFPTREEARFAAWFKALVKVKYNNSRLPGACEQEIRERAECVL